MNRQSKAVERRVVNASTRKLVSEVPRDEKYPRRYFRTLSAIITLTFRIREVFFGSR